MKHLDEEEKCDFCTCDATSRLWNERTKKERVTCDRCRDEKLADDDWSEMSFQ